MAQGYQTGDPVARVSPIERALLNAIAGGESRGQYNIRYTPQGGAPFNDFSRHPGIFEQGPAGPSSAAGRYQFTKTTWDRIMGPNTAFTPQNQDIAALKLAQMDYRSRTGRDIFGDLQREGFSSRIQSTLAPTWSALGGAQQRHAATFQQSLTGEQGPAPMAQGFGNGMRVNTAQGPQFAVPQTPQEQQAFSEIQQADGSEQEKQGLAEAFLAMSGAQQQPNLASVGRSAPSSVDAMISRLLSSPDTDITDDEDMPRYKL